MAIRDIHLLGSPVLRQRAAEIASLDEELRTLVDDMFDTMAAASGIGLAANQIGIARRIAVVNAEGQTLTMINPQIVEADGREVKEEGCLSIPEIYGDVSRPERVVLEALDEDFAPYRLEASGLVARAIQHEIDHLDGILFLDHLSPMKRTLVLSRWKREMKGKPLTRTPTPEEPEEGP